MNKLAKPVVAGVAVAMSLLFGLGQYLPKADAMAMVIFAPPQAEILPQDQVEEIKNHDVIVFIDSSRSMSRSVGPEGRFCTPIAAQSAALSPDGTSRWQWCSEQTEQMAKQLKSILKDQLKVVVFSENYKIYNDVTMGSVPTFFAKHTPGGMTNATVALRSQLRTYFAARDSHKGEVKPLLVAIITDGSPDDPASLKQAIIDATNRMIKPDEIAITFLQVGVDPKATQYLHELDSTLVSSNARYDIVTSKTFDQVNKSGLTLALLDAVHK